MSNIYFIGLQGGDCCVVSIRHKERVERHTWWRTNAGYVVTDIERVCISLSTFLMNPSEGFEVDHEIGDLRDYTDENLRVVTRQQNQQNKVAWHGKKSSRHKAVYFAHWKKTNPWYSRIDVNGKTVHLGYFPTEDLAALAYNEAAEKYYGEYARLNEIKVPPNGEGHNYKPRKRPVETVNFE